MALSKEQLVHDYENSKGGIIDITPLFKEEVAEYFFQKYNLLAPSLEMEEAMHPDKTNPRAVCSVHGLMKRQTTSNKIGYRYKCTVRTPEPGNPNKRCNASWNPGSGSFFEMAKITAGLLLRIIHGLVSNWGSQEMEDQLYVDHSTYTRWTTYIKEVMMIVNWTGIDQTKIGGPGLTIQIDETFVAKRKNNTGQVLASQGMWAFGGVCDDERMFIARVPARSKKDLLPLVFRCVANGTAIASDRWSSYVGLEQFPEPFHYSHTSVNHQENFVDPNTGVHTQKVERLWRTIKDMIKSYPETNGVLDRELGFAWYRRDNFGQGKNRMNLQQCLIRLVKDIAKVYPADGSQPLKMPDWVQFADPKQTIVAGQQTFEEWKEEWTANTGRTKIIHGYNVMGQGYGLVDQQLGENSDSGSSAAPEAEDMEVDDM